MYKNEESQDGLREQSALCATQPWNGVQGRRLGGMSQTAELSKEVSAKPTVSPRGEAS